MKEVKSIHVAERVVQIAQVTLQTALAPDALRLVREVAKQDVLIIVLQHVILIVMEAVMIPVVVHASI